MGNSKKLAWCQRFTTGVTQVASLRMIVGVVYLTHRTSLFPNSVWERLLSEAGFEPTMVTEETSERRPPRVFFVGHR